MHMSVQAASGRSDFTVICWLGKAAGEKVPKSELDVAPHECTTLDQKLATSLMAICTGDLLGHLTLMNQEHMSNRKRPLPALRVLREIYDSLRNTGALRRVNQITDLQLIHVWGDAHLATFRNQWVEIMGDIGDNITSEPKCPPPWLFSAAPSY